MINKREGGREGGKEGGHTHTHTHTEGQRRTDRRRHRAEYTILVKSRYDSSILNGVVGTVIFIA